MEQAEGRRGPWYTNTNVVRFHAAYSKNSGRPEFYVSGVGTRHKAIGRVLGGVFGLGELTRIEEGYKQLCREWIATSGKAAIDIIGFSRGAATALDFCHYLLDRGIRDPDTGRQLADAPEIRFLGLWDVVAAFGLANLGNQVLNFGHHLDLPRGNLKYCFHAMALDERRLSFLPTRLPGACEVWFRGVHSDIGGGNGNRGLNDLSMRWMMRKAMAAGLPIVPDDLAALQPRVVQPHPGDKLPLQPFGSSPASTAGTTPSRPCLDGRLRPPPVPSRPSPTSRPRRQSAPAASSSCPRRSATGYRQCGKRRRIERSAWAWASRTRT